MRITGTNIVKIAVSAAVLLGGAGAKHFIDDNKELSVDDVIQVVDSSGYNHAGLLHVKGKVKNISDLDNIKVTLTISFMDGSKNSLKSVKAVNDDLDAGEIWDFDVASLGKNAKYYSVEYIEIEKQ